MQIFEKIDISVDPGNIEDCHWVKTQRSKKVIIKLSGGKDANKICAEKKKLKGKNLTSLGINTPVYINDSVYILQTTMGQMKEVTQEQINLCFLDIKWFH